ncbi:MAG: methyltransferase, partial [Pseudomonadota bacterium]
MKKFLGLAGIFAGALALAACGGQESDAGAADVDAAAEEGQTVDASIEAALAGEHRSDEERARDVYRNPKETLLFFG